MKKPFFSIGIIFKNEIRCLERCLKSLQPLRDAVPCEVVMADTGSDDGSRDVAERYADVLFDFPWIDDFAAARNAVMDRCSGQWYISVDADEWLVEGVKELKEFSQTKRLPQDFAGYHIRNFQAVGELVEDNYVDFVAVRLARLSTGVRYEGCIHEGWKDPKGGLMQVMPLTETWFYHDGYTYVDEAAETTKRDRNLALLRRKLSENPEHLQTLMEYTDCVKRSDKEEAVKSVTRAMDGVRKKWIGWSRFGAVVFRNAVSVAALHKLPELEEWADQAVELFPNSSYTRIDVAYYAFSRCWENEDYSRALYWGEKYLQGMSDHKAGRFESSESMWGVLENTAPFWERKVLVLMPEAYLRCGEPEKAYAAFPKIKGEELEDPKQVELCTLVLIRLQRTTALDVTPLASAFWDQISQEKPDAVIAEAKRKILLDTASTSFTVKYRREEEGRDDFVRHGCTVFSGLKDQCELGLAAAILETVDCAELTDLLRRVEKWDELPIATVEHALLVGVPFPLPEQPLKIEEMDSLAARMAREDGPLINLAVQTAGGAFAKNWQSITWARGLVLAAVKSCNWSDEEQSMQLCRAFAKVERAFLPRYYAQEVLNAENIRSLPPLHRFGWYCAEAFQKLETQDAAAFAGSLRKGLETCPQMKAMVEFLTEHTPQLQEPKPTGELLALAERVRAMLAAYPADDPAVVMLKQSPVYQRVASLIEGPESASVSLMGSVTQ